MRAKLALGLILGLSVSLSALPALAHKTWLLPSATILSDKDPWVSVDAAVSNALFEFEHVPLSLDGLLITAPDGSKGQAENLAKAHYRNMFDLRLTQEGTWRLAVMMDGYGASYKLKGEQKRWRGPKADLSSAIPAEATEVNITHSIRRTETFVTRAKPSAVKISGKGLELEPITHPNDLYAGEKAKFRFLVDGKPAADLKITYLPGGSRWRDKTGEVTVTTDKDGVAVLTFAEPGYYWLGTSVDLPSKVKGEPSLSYGYVVTLDVQRP